MTNWLQNYAYHISLSVSVFVLSALLAITVVVLMVSYQSIRAALANPFESLRYE